MEVSLLLKEVLLCRDVRVQVPTVALRGEGVLLQCLYDLEGDSLYSVKWYKDNEEFFRYVPKANPVLHSYRLEGIKVDHHKSDSRRVFLRSVTLKTSGVFRCEVSAEAPSFSSGQEEGTLHVVHLPKDGPHITGERTQYEIGDDINLNCTSGRSHPPSILQWFINDKQVTRPDMLVPLAPVLHPGGLATSALGLRFSVRASHFVAGSMRVRCVASVTPAAPVLWSAGQEMAPVLGTASTVVLDNREAMLLVRSDSIRLRPSLLQSSIILLLLTTWFI
ncbi:uncharacterized protein LOC113386376 [Ctenocephalides felis]|uniref:uncharacterized protein LOC113386376 n=1 Tax=Ctenocephalides felis TaxID=7515 RepID=UPI000E6E4FFF|nr:uncharacterized protein LOC113386376 [Ctenocephalides felis]